MFDINKIKKEIVDRLLPLKPEKIILFGSYAYGTPTADSDLDICVIEKSFKSKIKEKTKIRKLLGDVDYAVDILVPDLDEYDFYKNEINSVYFDINKKGEVLWANT
jgi:uncharacterized protein